MEGGDIVYIILLVIFLLSGLFKKNKKANQKRTAQTMPFPPINEQKEEEDDYWFADEEKPEPVHSQEEQVTPPPVYNINKDTDAADHVRVRKNISTPVKSKTETTAPAHLTGGTQELIELNTAEDARRAFIYSEIFQRKY